MTKNYIKFKNRIIFIHIAIMLVWIGFGFRLFNIQIINKLNSPQGIKVETVKGLRGNFFDINGRNLTQNLTFYRIGIHSKKIINKDNFLNELSACTGTEKELYLAKLNGGRDYVELEKKTNKNCEKLQIKYPNALIIKKSFKRYYPEENLFSQIIGFTSIDDKGISGLELKYNNELEPISGSRHSKRNGLGKRISDPTLLSKEAKNGADIILTIDKRYQAILRDELIQQVENVGAHAGRGLIINPKNGAILAMVNVPDYNPNSPNDFDVELQKNKIVTDLIEPGSTFKIVTVAAALKENVPLGETTYVDTVLNFHGIKKIRDTKPMKARLTMAETLKHSSNIGIINFADPKYVGNVKLYEKAKELGFGRKTGFDSSSEPSGMLRHPDKWTLSSMHSIPLGYEVSTTPLQIAMAYAAIADRGWLKKPFIVKKINENYNLNKIGRVKVIDPNHAKDITDMLELAVNEEHNAYIKDWHVAGKTGTSKKLINNQYSDKEFISSFVGFLPAEDPQLLCMIVIDGADASQKMHYGHESAAPVFKSVMERVLSIANLSPDPRNRVLLSSETEVGKKNKSKEEKEIKYVIMPNCIGKNVRETSNILKQAGIKAQISGRGLIAGQSIPPGEKIEIGTICLLKAELKE